MLSRARRIWKLSKHLNGRVYIESAAGTLRLVGALHKGEPIDIDFFGNSLNLELAIPTERGNVRFRLVAPPELIEADENRAWHKAEGYRAALEKIAGVHEHAGDCHQDPGDPTVLTCGRVTESVTHIARGALRWDDDD